MCEVIIVHMPHGFEDLRYDFAGLMLRQGWSRINVILKVSHLEIFHSDEYRSRLFIPSIRLDKEPLILVTGDFSLHTGYSIGVGRL